MNFPDFDAFEFTGIIAPGSLVLIALVLLYPQLRHGADAPIVILTAVMGSYILGHVIAAIGNLAERLFRVAGIDDLESIPFQQWLSRGYYSEDQEGWLRREFEKLKWLVFEKDDSAPESLRRRRAVVKQMYLTAPRPEKLETFNGLASLSRGLGIAFVICSAISFAAQRYLLTAACLGAAVLMLWRVYRFLNSYSRELIQQTVSKWISVDSTTNSLHAPEKIARGDSLIKEGSLLEPRPHKGGPTLLS